MPDYGYYQIQWCLPGEAATSMIDLSSDEERAPVYELERARRSYAYVQQLAHELNIDAAPIYQPQYDSPFLGSVDAVFVVKGASGELIVGEDQPGISYRSKASPRGDTTSGQSVSDSGAENRARDFLRAIGLYPTAEVETNVDRRSLAGRIDVVFRPAHIQTDLGTRSQEIIIQLEGSGDVWGLDYYWQEPKEVGKYPLISEKEALERLRHCQGVISPHDESMQITHVKPVYLGVPVNGPYEYLIPAFHFWDDYPIASQHAIIPAIVDEYLPLQSAATPRPK